MNETQGNSQTDIIRITKAEAASEHVDDLLKRQMNLRGEAGKSSRNQARWYYQNWFVFMMAGSLAAFIAWAVIEPFFDDRLYIQGVVQEVNASSIPVPNLTSGRHNLELGMDSLGWIRLKNEKIWIAEDAKWLPPHGKKKPVELSELTPGQTVGVYVEYIPFGKNSLSIGLFLVPDPPPQSARQAELLLSDLSSQHEISSLLLFPLVAGMIGLFIGTIDGLICRLWRRALLSGLIGLLLGFIGGFIFSFIAGIVYGPISAVAMNIMAQHQGMTATAFLIQMGGRALGWMLAGIVMGLGQGVALRSGRLLLYGFLGGVVGGLVGGLLFDPIDLLLLGTDKPSALWSRMIGLLAIGACVGGMIGLVELLARDAWLRMIQGPLAGKEFLLFKDIMRIGSSPRAEIYLFNDPGVPEFAATLRATSDLCEIEARHPDRPIMVNQRPTVRTRLRSGDQITLGRTIFVFEKRQTS